ncbi:MAG TPA: helix-turn-helix transcriptional regulator [Solirubrobacteraceae bacterium]|nr:helix-turn-helix transcriptional regulator [Solirubrobacteraceae bacterium]
MARMDGTRDDASPTDEQLVQLGQQLEAARKAAGLSGREVAEAAGLSAPYLRAIERGSNPKTGKPSRPRAEAVLGIARALGLDPAKTLSAAGYPAAPFANLDGEASQAPARRAVDDLLRQLQESVKGLNRRSPFMYARTVERLEEFAADFRVMANGALRSTPEDEPHLTRQAVDECRSHLRAVSYQDEPWWPSAAGDSYLELHKELAQRDVEMTRIFILDQDALADLRPTLERHVELNIRTFVLLRDEVNDYYWRDFVLYDDVLLRMATPVDATSERKSAEFTDDRGRIMQALEDFKYLYRVASTHVASVERILERPV